MKKLFCLLAALALLAQPLRAAEEPKRYLALTFDDGPSGELTERLLEGLAERQVHATFFVCGYRIAEFPDTLSHIAAAGHEIGLHSSNHDYMQKMDYGTALRDLTGCAKAVEDACGVRAQLFRPPGGLYGDTLLRAAKDAGLSVILWSVDPCDWNEAAWDGVLPTVLRSARRQDHPHARPVRAFGHVRPAGRRPAAGAGVYVLHCLRTRCAARHGASARRGLYRLSAAGQLTQNGFRGKIEKIPALRQASPGGVHMEKKDLRAFVRAKKRAMTPAQVEAASVRLAQQLFRHPAYQAARSLYGYLSYNQEVRTAAILRRAQQDGKRVAVPKVFGDEMKFLWLDDLSAVAPGAYNIPEPVADGPEADDETALVLMPGLAFDPEGHRCGYGGGFYDKYLAAHPKHVTLALCYGFQMFSHLDTDAFDIPVQYVISAPVEEEKV